MGRDEPGGGWRGRRKWRLRRRGRLRLQRDEVGGAHRAARRLALPPGRTATATAAGDGGRGSPEAMGIEAEAEAAIARWFKATREIRWLRAGVSGVGEELAQLTSITMGFGGRGWARSVSLTEEGFEFWQVYGEVRAVLTTSCG